MIKFSYNLNIMKSFVSFNRFQPKDPIFKEIGEIIVGCKKYQDKRQEKKKSKNKVREKCCEKYIKKGKHCKGCPAREQCELPEK